MFLNNLMIYYIFIYLLHHTPNHLFYLYIFVQIYFKYKININIIMENILIEFIGLDILNFFKSCQDLILIQKKIIIYLNLFHLYLSFMY